MVGKGRVEVREGEEELRLREARRVLDEHVRDRMGFVRLGSERLQAVVGERNAWGFGELFCLFNFFTPLDFLALILSSTSFFPPAFNCSFTLRVLFYERGHQVDLSRSLLIVANALSLGA